jgi:hypothetical protein
MSFNTLLPSTGGVHMDHALHADWQSAIGYVAGWHFI